MKIKEVAEITELFANIMRNGTKERKESLRVRKIQDLRKNDRGRTLSKFLGRNRQMKFEFAQKIFKKHRPKPDITKSLHKTNSCTELESSQLQRNAFKITNNNIHEFEIQVKEYEDEIFQQRDYSLSRFSSFGNGMNTRIETNFSLASNLNSWNKDATLLGQDKVDQNMFSPLPFSYITGFFQPTCGTCYGAIHKDNEERRDETSEYDISCKKEKNKKSLLILSQENMTSPLYQEAFNFLINAIDLYKRKQFIDAFEMLEEALVLSQMIGLSENHDMIVETNSYLSCICEAANEMHNNGAYFESIADYDNALLIFQKVSDLKFLIFASNPSTYATPYSKTLHCYGVTLWKVGSYLESIEELDKAFRVTESIEQKWKDVERDMAEILISLGNSFLSKGDFEQAMDFYKQSLHKVKEMNNTNEHLDLSKPMLCVGNAYSEQGRHKEAMNYYSESLRIQRLFHKKEDITSASTLNYIGVIHEKCGEYEKAMKCYQEALSSYRSILGNCHVDVAVTLVNIGQIYRSWSMYDKARYSYELALGVFRKILGNNHRNVASTLHHIGQLQLVQNEDILAFKTFQIALKIQKEALGTHKDVAITLDSLGDLFHKTGKQKKALLLYRKALKIRQSTLGRTHFYTGISLHRLGDFYKNVTRSLIDASKMYKEALHVYEMLSIPKDDNQMKTLMNSIAALQKRKEKP